MNLNYKIPIFVTGGTGFLGKYVLETLYQKGFENVCCLVRPTSNCLIVDSLGYRSVTGNLEDLDMLRSAMKDYGIVLNIASLGFGHAPFVVRAMEEAGVSRGVFVSTTSLFTNLNVTSKKIRIEAEETIRNSNLNYTILRPTMIYGDLQDRNISRLVRFISRYPIIPVLGSGDFLQQPVCVKDVAAAIISSAFTSTTECKSYNIPGSHSISYNQMIDVVSEQLQKKIIKIHIPMQLSRKLLRLVKKIKEVGITDEQILRLNEDKAFEYEEARADFGYEPISFEEGVKDIIKLL